MPRKKENDFTKKVIDTLAKRAGNRCSNPDCNKNTIGPGSSSREDIACIGVAAHIHAASPGGPRFDSLLNEKQLSSIDNAIHLCQDCAHLVDTNHGNAYPADLLKKWKDDNENKTRENIGKRTQESIKPYIGFTYSKIELEKNITGDGTSFQPKFSICDKHINNQTFICLNPGIYRIRWHLNLENITDQESATVKIISSNEVFKIDYPVPNLKTSDDKISLRGEKKLECNLLDTIEFHLSIGNCQNQKNNRSFFVSVKFF